MGDRSQWIRTLATLGLLVLLAHPASADAINFTGDVELDFPNVDGNGITVIVDNPGSNNQASPGDVAQSGSLTGITGWNIKDLRLAYDESTDVMSFGVNFFGIAGDADGDGNPGGISGSIGRDVPSLGGRESIVVALDTDRDGTPDVVAGVPTNKPQGTISGVDTFTVAAYEDSPAGLASSFGKTLTEHLGALAFDPSAEHPDFEFTITNFKELPGLVPEDGFIISAFAGTTDDIIAGEDFVFNTGIGFPGSGQQQIPEPTTWLAWSLVAGGAFLLRRSFQRHRAH